MSFLPLTRSEIKSVIEGRSFAKRIPVMIKFWTVLKSFEHKREELDKILNKYPEDVQPLIIRTPRVFEAPSDDPGYRWANIDDPDKDKKTGLDEKIAISDWSQLDDILADFPDPSYPNLFPVPSEDDGRYRLGTFWFCFFERHWSLRGMTNALMDYYTDPESVHRLFRALTDFYKAIMVRARNEQAADGIFTSDDIGMQTGPFFSKQIFDEFFAPYYKELIDTAHSLGMHFWLHTCGNIEDFLPDFVKMGLDVIHPIQKYTMEEKKIALEYGKDICIWAGFDVQRTIPWGSAEDVRREVRFIIDTFARKEGRLMFTAGNGINADCPLSSLEALFDEALSYGEKKIKEM